MAGGTLVLGDKAVLSGDPAKAPVNPTEDIVWLTSTGDEDGRYPAPGNAVVIGGTSGAEVHGSCDGFIVVMEDRTSHIKLTGDFECSCISLNGETDLDGRTLTADNVYYGNDSRVLENGREYTFTVAVNAEPDWNFTDDVDIVIRGAKYVSHAAHIDDNRGKADILFITATMKPTPTGVRRGDTDNDKEITIIDATYIQRELAGMSNLLFVDEAADVDCDNEMSIFDATAIQRYLAGYEDGYPVGEEIDAG